MKVKLIDKGDFQPYTITIETEHEDDMMNRLNELSCLLNNDELEAFIGELDDNIEQTLDREETLI